MLNVTLDEDKNIAMFEPHGPLTQTDFESAVRIIDPYLQSVGKLKGLIIATPDFPGWDSFAALISHLRFVHDHHTKVGKVALVTDSSMSAFGEHVAAHFINAEIKAFGYTHLHDAKRWVAD
ncbi:STAS/SEC14 domain-containing protein [Pseudoalteromonas sp. SSDWG2]|uniref:STAS/SEC14 domain-containing protein n=1 Tax=Pseudoalteromonas sp. SSDWG2 TaxID=3139391 RepID=UPI003BABD8EE